MKFKIIFILLILISVVVKAQNIEITGFIKDSLRNPLEYANILAVPNAENADMRFSITDKAGKYLLKLEANHTYEVTVSYLGYLPQNLTLAAEENDVSKSFTLKEGLNQLTEVELHYTPPVTVKKDTIIYLTDKFVTGEERKLRDVLKKLPGVEVDRDGNVTSNGKRVTKVLVENKMFFTGDSKLAVNNIPADAIDKVEMLDNYNKVAMLKGLQDSDDLAMNITLKEDKKKFVFGDVEGGAGIKERYMLHPNIFYYSPETTINFIGDINNTGVKSFTFRDYLEFEGGTSKLLQDAGSYIELFNSDFARYLNNDDFKANTNQFAAANIRQSISKDSDISAYVITNNAKTEAQSETNTAYLDNNTPFIEDRTSANNVNTFFTIGKLTYDYAPSFKEDLSFNSFVKITNNDSQGFISTINPAQNNQIETQSDIKNINLKQHISYSKKLNDNHTGTLEASYTYQNDKPITNWVTNQQILQGLIPLETDNFYNILQNKKIKTHVANAIVKDYWVLNSFNHIYTSVGVNAAYNDLYSNDSQLLSDGSINDFESAGFGNEFQYQFVNPFIGLEYKFQIGIATFKPAIYYHLYLWSTKQLNDSDSKRKALFLPQFTSNIEFNNSEKIRFKYQLNSRFPSVDQLASNFVLSSFNRVYKGNPNLENQLYHSASLYYYKSSFFKGFYLNIGTSVNKKIEQTKTVTQLNGIEQFNTEIMFRQPEHSWTVNGAINKKIKKISYKFKSRFRYNDFYQVVNNQTHLNISKGISSTVSLESFFKNWPNFEIGYTKDFSNYKAFGNKTNFENDEVFTRLEYDFLENFIIKADYTFDSYKNKTTGINNQSDNANASLFYQTENSPWGFEIGVSNIFNTEFKQQNSFSSFYISDSKTFIMPRIFMFKVAYKL
ncbi:carboxypeptidase regulatory-like domain-containing protein [Bizionia argentinensis JUB59]|uniref:Carboxypeptidase regulatory-like domain-containing protein n=1 Tax=Bizionia argentinensis JUB59 TaxID=1046627 RepID=G2EEY3_9FLAO|nr:carboxypeptidase-like regulatory domain-containing protein [Bizionia argentinensis]EGV43007.1 carboxypeptidase regulatory-like domain-containing protein [Bizionia argentinensis JUB59]